MSIRTVVTRGYGSFGTVTLVPVRGYGSSGGPTPILVPVDGWTLSNRGRTWNLVNRKHSWVLRRPNRDRM